MASLKYSDQDNMLCRVPGGDKKPVRIPRWKYELIEAAMLDALRSSPSGLSQRELVAKIRDRLFADDLDQLGSLMWHVVTVKLELETRGLVGRREKGRDGGILTFLLPS